MQKTIAIDFDGVIADTDPLKLSFARNVLGLKCDQSMMKLNYFIQEFGVQGGKIYGNIIKGVYQTDLMLTAKVIRDAKESIAELQEQGWRCIVVTSRTGAINQESSALYWAWRFIQANDINISNNNFFSSQGDSKLAICKSTEAFALVDNDYEKLLPIIDSGLLGYLFSSSTNSMAEKENRDFRAIRVNGWLDIIKRLSLFSGG